MAHKAAPKLPRLRMREELLKVLRHHNQYPLLQWTEQTLCVFVACLTFY